MSWWGISYRNEIKKLALSHSNLKIYIYKLAGEIKDGSDQVPIDALVGTDIVKFLGELRIVKSVYGCAFELLSGIIPYCNIYIFVFLSNWIKQLS